MRWRLTVLVLAALLLAVNAGAAKKEKEKKKEDKKAPAVMIDSLVATVENETITIDDLQIGRVLLSRTGVWFSLAAPPKEITEPEILEELITRILLYGQARKMGFGEMSEDTVKIAMSAFRETFPDDDAYGRFLLQYQLRDDAFPVANQESRNFLPLRQHFYRELVINQFVEKKINVQVRLGLSTYLAENRARLLAERPGAGDEELERLAHRELFNRKLLDLVADLRGRANVVILRERK